MESFEVKNGPKKISVAMRHILMEIYSMELCSYNNDITLDSRINTVGKAYAIDLRKRRIFTLTSYEFYVLFSDLTLEATIIMIHYCQQDETIDNPIQLPKVYEELEVANHSMCIQFSCAIMHSHFVHFNINLKRWWFSKILRSLTLRWVVLFFKSRYNFYIGLDGELTEPTSQKQGINLAYIASWMVMINVRRMGSHSHWC